VEGYEPMQIRRTVPTDFLAIAALDREAWKEGENAEFIPDGEHIWRLWTEHAIMFCAEVDVQIVGAIVAFPCLDGRYCLHKVFVKRDFRDKGIGSQLFEVLLQEIDEKGVSVFLTVSPGNEAAIALYEKWGFDRRELVKGYYREVEDRYVLSRVWEKDGRGR
jgi:ribosomal protein S18 acetylase RimI-like enzyme